MLHDVTTMSTMSISQTQFAESERGESDDICSHGINPSTRFHAPNSKTCMLMSKLVLCVALCCSVPNVWVSRFMLYAETLVNIGMHETTLNRVSFRSLYDG